MSDSEKLHSECALIYLFTPHYYCAHSIPARLAHTVVGELYLYINGECNANKYDLENTLLYTCHYANICACCECVCTLNYNTYCYSSYLRAITTPTINKLFIYLVYMWWKICEKERVAAALCSINKINSYTYTKGE
jgi:hypothetical protein